MLLWLSSFIQLGYAILSSSVCCPSTFSVNHKPGPQVPGYRAGAYLGVEQQAGCAGRQPAPVLPGRHRLPIQHLLHLCTGAGQPRRTPGNGAVPRHDGLVRRVQEWDGRAGLFVLECWFPVNQYFWLNSLHPTYPIYDLCAKQIVRMLG
jgi:hypothetical protein